MFNLFSYYHSSDIMNAPEQTELPAVFLKMWLICFFLSFDCLKKCIPPPFPSLVVYHV